MTPAEFEYIQRAVKALEEPLALPERVKIQRTMAQILERSAEKLKETVLEDHG